jgi:hypothetical protein
MERKSEQLAALAETFSDVDFEVIENVLEICKGKTTLAAEMLLKMKEEAEGKIQEKPEARENLNRMKEGFLEIEEKEKGSKKGEGKRKEKKKGGKKEEEIEEEYMEHVQMAIRRSLEESKAQNRKSDKVSGKNQKKEVLHKKTEEKSVEKGKSIENGDEEVYHFIFTDKVLIRGERAE